MSLEYVLAIDVNVFGKFVEFFPQLSQKEWEAMEYIILRPIQFAAPLAKGQDVYICNNHLGPVEKIVHEHDGQKMITYALFKSEDCESFLPESSSEKGQGVEKLIAGFGKCYTVVDIPYTGPADSDQKK